MLTDRRRFPSLLIAALVSGAALAACAGGPRNWGQFNALRDRAPDSPAKLGPVPLKNGADYGKVLRWGADWFRSLTFGNERTMTDATGLLNGTVEIPCPQPCAEGCYKTVHVLPYFMAAIDDLDGVRGNLFQGNGGPSGNGYTHDLVVRFPKGTKLFGTIPVPENLHSGLDVEAGASLPIGVVPIAARPDEQNLPYLIDLAEFGPGAPKAKVRLGLTCAVCHYSLDVDWDGKADLKSAWLDQPTPGSKYKPQDAWAIGNQDIHFGWLFSLSANPVLGFTVQSGPVGPHSQRAARDWAKWVYDNLRVAPEAVKREVAIGMLAEPRGWADDTPDAVHNPTQFPSLFTHMNWPYNVDGVLVNGSDRNNNVWTAALEFSALIGFGNNRAGSTQKFLFWEEQSVYAGFTAEQLAEVMLYFAPFVTTAPNAVEARKKLDELKADVLGTSDGVPGLLDPKSVIVMEGLPGVIPRDILHASVNNGRRRVAKDYGEDARYRNVLVGMMGMRVRTPPAVRDDAHFQQFLRDYPQIAGDPVRVDEVVTDAVSLMLNWNKPPTNHSRLLANAAPLVEKGYEIFKQSGCEPCHRGPFFTDNLIMDFRTLGTNNQRAVATRPLQAFIAPDYDPATGEAQSLRLFSRLIGGHAVGYKTLTLRYLWGSAPYLHDGGVGVSLNPQGAPAGDDLGALLKRQDKIYGIARPLTMREAGLAPNLRSDAALSLQALLLKSERARVIDANRNDRAYEVPGLTDKFTMVQIGVEGIGHEYYVDDVPGGPKITSLVAFLLALDDCPGQHMSPPQRCGP